MKKISTKLLFVLLSTLPVWMVSCGSDKEGGEEGGADQEVTCNEKNTIEVAVPAEEGMQGFQLKKTLAMKSGWSISGDQKSERVMIYFANYEASIGSYWINQPQNDGEYVIEISINGKNSGKDEALVPITTGQYNYGSSLDQEPTLSVGIFKKGAAVQVFNRTDKVTGKATITQLTDKMVCGSVDITDPEGNVIKASFSAAIEKDLSGDFK